MIGLIAPHGIFTGLIPGSSRLAAQVMLANQRFLDLLRPLRINFLLAPCARLSLTVAVRRTLRSAFVSRGGRIRLGGRSGSIRRLRGSTMRRTAGTDQRQSAASTQPSPHSRDILVHIQK